MSQVKTDGNSVTPVRSVAENVAIRLTNDPSSFRLVADAFLHRQHGLSPFQQLLLLYGPSVCVRVL
jgi:hypothetical protein